jgi:hypothetical protein
VATVSERDTTDGNSGSVQALLARDAIDLADSADLPLVRWRADPQ